MRFAASISLLLLSLAPLGFAQQAGKESGLTAIITQLPSCALSCLTQAIAASPCELTDTACICTNAELNANVEGCVLRSCTLRESLTTKNLTTTTCHAPVRSKNMTLKLTNIILGAVSATCVLTRILYKSFFSAGELGWDDYIILATVVFGIPSTIIQDIGTIKHGLGKDVWTLSFGTITAFVKWFYIIEVLYFFNVAMLKLSLLFFFLRIFPAKPIKRLLWATIAFNICFGIAFIVTAIFQCTPIRFYWEKWDGEHVNGKCINLNALGWANAAISILLDIWMLALPLWQVLQLKLAWKKKVSVAMMFFVGTFVTVISIIRLQSLISFATSTNPTWDQADAANWSTIEINVGIICACMPALRLILVRIFPRALGSTQYASNQYYAKYGTNRSGAFKSGHNASVGRSQMGHDDAFASKNANAITYTTTFEVRHGDDEEQLVPMDDLSAKGHKVRSSGSSQASVSAASTPVVADPPRRLS
ncbi:hypothetical protein DPSP01_008028 [Paraphaeosphaeria sporulosa]|uniref:CFEM domain-containing protein n=1 Tax=Paraphaeosphaeria sporulosa TaxID=1460663 RepID=A0A177CQ09_9PLEO|nr:uncharacterized protein CC84DRAFT_593015 [Paraphaeosphaeria sporulosa]OAG08859.1 hypothetical protein CC84DRAFT_593015 [Paraphaeosphaeria sporulosa]